MFPRSLTAQARCLHAGLILAALLFGGVVLFKSVGLSRRQGDLGCFCRAGWAIRQGGAPLYHVLCDNHWHYNYPPLFAILMVPLADPPQRDLSLTAGMVLGLSNSPCGGPLLAASAAAASPAPLYPSEPYYLSYAVSVVVFYLVSLLMLVCSIHLLAGTLERFYPPPKNTEAAWRRYWAWRLGPVVVFSPLIGLTFVRGQVQTLLLLLLAGVIVGLLRGRRMVAGLCIGGAICLKLFPAFLVVLPLWRRDGRCLAGVGFALAAGLVIIPVLVLGPTMTAQVYRDYAEFTILPALGLGKSDSRSTELINATATQSQAFQVILHKTLYLWADRVPAQPAAWVKLIHWSFGGLLTLATLRFLSRRWLDPLAVTAGVGMLALVMVLLSPVCHLHYFLVGLPVLLALRARLDVLGSRRGKFALTCLSICLIAAWSVPMIPGLGRLRDVGVPMFGALGLWLTAWLGPWQIQEVASSSSDARQAA